jgi:hypothetical protein
MTRASFSTLPVEVVGKILRLAWADAHQKSSDMNGLKSTAARDTLLLLSRQWVDQAQRVVYTSVVADFTQLQANVVLLQERIHLSKFIRSALFQFNPHHRDRDIGTLTQQEANALLTFLGLCSQVEEVHL